MQSLAPPPRLLHCFRRQPKTPYKLSVELGEEAVGGAHCGSLVICANWIVLGAMAECR
jgi:hypothetical protein